MRVPVKLLGFGFWLFSFNFAQCQECLRENIKYADIVPVGKASYADGETVKVNCVAGYTGLYKLKCEKGGWKKSIERPCAKKKCGHPGDTQNGDFKLTEGTEFVFGATVVYTCKKGYEMASRINQRTCRTQGWDNAVPVCEVVKCPAISTDGEVTASGNTEEGRYGDVIQFECVSSDKIIDGSSDIQCEETGKWSDVVPKCKEITCTAPVIPNGYVVEPRPKYPKDATLKYKCNKRFKPKEGIPKCAKFGWTLKPECDEVTCELKSTTIGVKKTNPYGKTIFRAGESVEITCSEKHWFFFTKEKSRSFTCKDNGQWDYEPVCAEITCEYPRDQHVSRPYYWGTMKLGEKQSYSCASGYRKTAAEATCTQDGWTPKPLCAEIMCDLPKFPNAEIVGSQNSNYKINSRIQYKCRSGFEPEEPVQIICDSQGQWRGIQQCTAMCAAPNIPNAEIVGGQRPNYRINSKVEYKCRPGFEPEEPVQITCNPQGQWTGIQQCTAVTCELKSTTIGVKKTNPYGKTIFRAGESVEITCSEKYWFFFTKEKSRSFTCKDNGEWDDEPVCAEITCEDPRDQHVSTPYNWGKMKLGEKQSYSCAYGYRKTAAKATCTQDGWTPKPLCAEIMCDLPKISNAEIVGRQNSNYKINSNIQYKCRSGFEPEQPVQITCDSQGQWRGIQQCTEVTCELKSTTIGVKKTNPYGKTIFRAGESVEITCSEKYWFFFTKEKSRSFTCKDNGEWDYEPGCAEITCEDPRDQHVSTPYNWGTMKLGEKQSYSCAYGYRKTAAEATCTQDGWTPKPLCAEIMCDLPKIPNAEIVGSQNSNFKINSSIQYKCRSGFEPDEPVQITCDSQDQWTGIHQCTEKCGPPPNISNADTKEMTKNNTEERVEYSCFDKYILDLRPPFSSYLTCVKGEWKGKIYCLKPCIVTVEEMDKRGIRLKWKSNEKIISTHNDGIDFACQSGKKLKAQNLPRSTCNDGVMNLPECEE